MKSGQTDRGELSRAASLVTGIGCAFSLAVAAGIGLGLGVMKLTGSALALVAGILAGIALGGYAVYRMVMRLG